MLCVIFPLFARSIVAANASSEAGSPIAAEPIGPGRVVLVVGPSGAGKDAVLGEAAKRLGGDPRFLFPKRVVTRESNAADDGAPVRLTAVV